MRNFHLFQKTAIALLLLLFGWNSVSGQKDEMITLPSGVRLNYVETGNTNQPATILLHGYSDSWKSFEPVLPLFPRGEHVIAITLRGHGDSSRPDNGYAIKDYATDIAEFIRQKNLEDVMVAGHSMGGMVAQRLAIDHPELVSSLVIIASESNFSNNPGMDGLGEVINAFDGEVPGEFIREFQLSTIYSPVDSAFIEQCIDESAKLPVHVWKETFSGIMTFNTTNELHNIMIPVLIMFGDHDAVIPTGDFEEFSKGIMRSVAVPYTGTGHAIHWEFPEKFVSDLMLFKDQYLSGR